MANTKIGAMKGSELRRLLEPILKENKIEYSITKSNRLIIKALNGEYMSLSTGKSAIQPGTIKQTIRRIGLSIEDIL